MNQTVTVMCDVDRRRRVKLSTTRPHHVTPRDVTSDDVITRPGRDEWAWQLSRLWIDDQHPCRRPAAATDINIDDDDEQDCIDECQSHRYRPDLVPSQPPPSGYSRHKTSGDVNSWRQLTATVSLRRLKSSLDLVWPFHLQLSWKSQIL